MPAGSSIFNQLRAAQLIRVFGGRGGILGQVKHLLERMALGTGLCIAGICLAVACALALLSLGVPDRVVVPLAWGVGFVGSCVAAGLAPRLV